MSKQAYERGVVIIKCDGCQAKHLMADHLGWFDTVGGKMGTIEDIVARMDGGVDSRGRGVVRLKLADVAGKAVDTDTAAGEGLMEWLPKVADDAAFGDKTAGSND